VRANPDVEFAKLRRSFDVSFIRLFLRPEELMEIETRDGLASLSREEAQNVVFVVRDQEMLAVDGGRSGSVAHPAKDDEFLG
jgi:hypothetical protein